MVLPQTFEALGFFEKMHFVEASVILMIVAFANIFIDFFLLSIVSVIVALFLPGYLFARLVLDKINTLESIIFGMVLSIGLEVVMVLVLVKIFAFSFDKLTIIESALFLNITLLALIVLKRIFSEYTIVKE